MILLPKPFWLRLVTAESTWVTLAPRVYHPVNVDPRAFPAVVSHEIVHIHQQEATGLWAWLIKYFTDSAFRLDQEARAIAVELLNTRPEDRPGAMGFYVDALCGRMYFHAASGPDEALAAIQSHL